MTEYFKTLSAGDEQFQRTMDGLVQFSRRPRLAMRAMAGVLEDQTELNFEKQGRPRWEELSESTKIKRIGGAKAFKKDGYLRTRSKRAINELMILQDRGLLAASFSSQYGDNYALIGSGGIPYARIHQLGGEAGVDHSVEIVSRPYLPFTSNLKIQPEAEKQLLKTGLDHLRDSCG